MDVEFDKLSRVVEANAEKKINVTLHTMRESIKNFVPKEVIDEEMSKKASEIQVVKMRDKQSKLSMNLEPLL